MFNLRQRFQSLKSKFKYSVPNSGKFHPSTPVVPETSINYQEMSVFRREYFPQNEPASWLDRPDAPELVNELVAKNQLTKAEAEICHKWIEDGYIIIEGMFDGAILDRAWAESENAIAEGKISPELSCSVNGLPGRNLNTHLQVPKIAELLGDRQVTDTISMLFGAKCLPFQTITGHNGSQQLEHSDAIHHDYLSNGLFGCNLDGI